MKIIQDKMHICMKNQKLNFSNHKNILEIRSYQSRIYEHIAERIELTWGGIKPYDLFILGVPNANI